MKVLSIFKNLICRIQHQHLLENGVGEYSNFSINGATNSFVEFIISIAQTILGFLANLVQDIYRILGKFVYFLIKLALNIMDLVMVIISELTGQAGAYDLSVANSNLEQSDILLSYLLNSFTLNILWRIALFSIFLLILITIFALVINEWKNASGGKGGDYKKVIVRSLKSFFTMLVTPFFVILGILFSNVILSSCISVLNNNNTTRFSVGATIFTAGTYEANWYRRYADANEKIPILFDFNGGFYNVENAGDSLQTGGNLKDELNELKNNVALTSGYSTYSMLKEKQYFSFDQVPEDSSYYAFYDGEYLKTKRIEYYVMADFIDYAMESGIEFYIKNVEDVYNNAVDIVEQFNDLYPSVVIELPPEATEEEKEKDLIIKSYYKYFSTIFDTIEPYIDNPGTTADEKAVLYEEEEFIYNTKYRDDVDYFNFNVYYSPSYLQQCGDVQLKTDENGFITGETQYKSLAGAKDEAYGAKYMYCHKVTVPLDSELTTFAELYVPVTQDTYINNYYLFDSLFLESESDLNARLNTTPETYIKRPNNVFLARGAFNTTGYPTAIRQDGADVVFYRHGVEAPSFAKLSTISSYLENSSDGSQTDLGGSGDFFSRVLGFDDSTISSDTRLELASSTQYNKYTVKFGEFKNGLFTLNYSFINSGIDINNVYDVLYINFVILILASCSLLITLFNMIWALLQRLLELTVYWFTYPAWLVKFPLTGENEISNDGTWGAWRESFLMNVIKVYSVYLGLVLFYTFVPMVIKANIIPAEVTIVAGAGNPLNTISPVLVSWVIKVMFMLVLFTLTSKTTGLFNELTGAMDDGSDIFGSIKGNIRHSFAIFSPTNLKPKKVFKTAKDKVQRAFHDTVALIPGSGIIDTAAHAVRANKENTRHKRAIQAFTSSSLRAGNNSVAVSSSTSNLNDSTTNYVEQRGRYTDNERERVRGEIEEKRDRAVSAYTPIGKNKK